MAADPAVELCTGGAAACAAVAASKLLGIDGGYLGWAFIGALAGVAAARSMPRLRAILAFIVASPLAALLGAGVAHRWLPGVDSDVWGHALAALLALALPHLLGGLLAQLERRSSDIVGVAIDRVLKSTDTGPKP